MKNTAARVISCIMVLVSIATISSSLFFSPKFVDTAFRLDRISTEISHLNREAELAAPGYGWNEKRTQRYEKLQSERMSIYSSEDPVVNWFANQNNFVQAGALLLTLIIFAIGFACCVVLGMRWYHLLKKMIK